MAGVRMLGSLVSNGGVQQRSDGLGQQIPPGRGLDHLVRRDSRNTLAIKRQLHRASGGALVEEGDVAQERRLKAVRPAEEPIHVPSCGA